jgi:hypothetical protein
MRSGETVAGADAAATGGRKFSQPRTFCAGRGSEHRVMGVRPRGA